MAFPGALIFLSLVLGNEKEFMDIIQKKIGKKNHSVARSVNTIDPEIREILILTFCPGFAFATYMI